MYLVSRRIPDMKVGERTEFCSDSQGWGGCVEGVVGVYHAFPYWFSGKLCVCCSDCFGVSYLVDLVGVELGEPLFNSIQQDWFY